MFDFPIREALRRKAAQTEAQGDGNGDIAQLCEAAGTLPSPEDPPGAASDRRMLGDAGVRYGAGVRQSR